MRSLNPRAGRLKTLVPRQSADNGVMETSMSTNERADELADLRRRAYGPDADIHGDPEALRRLEELEQRARPVAAPPGQPRGEEAPGDIEESAAEQASESPDAIVPESDEHGTDEAPATEAPGTAVVPWWRRPSIWAVAAVSLVVGGVLSAAAVAWSTPPPLDPPDATLAIRGGGEVDPGWLASVRSWGVDPDSLARFEEYDVLGVWSGITANDDRCLLLSYRREIFRAACATAGLDPVLDLYADEGWLFTLNEPLLPGGVIRFVAHPESVDVWFRQGTPSLPVFEE